MKKVIIERIKRNNYDLCSKERYLVMNDIIEYGLLEDEDIDFHLKKANMRKIEIGK